MPRGKKAEPKEEKILAEAPTAPADARLVAGQEIDAETALREASQAAERPQVKADPDGNIDERMQALLEDHQRMGVRPA